MTTPLEQLLIVQEHDIVLDQLRHRRETLPERDVLVRSATAIRELHEPIVETSSRRDVVSRDVHRLEDEAVSVAGKAAEVNLAMYSGKTTSSKELQAMQADLEQLQRHQRTIEDRELELMEQQEAIDAELGLLVAQVATAEADISDARAAIARLEAQIDGEIVAEVAARSSATVGISDDLLALYESCRGRARGIGVARLVGHTCQGCRLTIPASEVERVRHAGPETPVSYCDNCGAILVPSH